jgi:hypothetical protein
LIELGINPGDTLVSISTANKLQTKLISTKPTQQVDLKKEEELKKETTKP